MYMKSRHGPRFAICGELSADVHKLSTIVSSNVQEYQNEEAESRT